MILACYFPFSWVTIFSFFSGKLRCSKIKMTRLRWWHSFLGNLIGVKTQISLKQSFRAMYRFMCYEIFYGNSSILPKLRFFYFSVKAVSIGIPGSFRIPANADIWTINQYRLNICQESSFQSRKNQKATKVKFNKRTAFHWFKSWLFPSLNCS